jgi:hypothetical protein
MTGNFEQPKHTGASAAWPGASTSLVQADDILTPEELAAYALSLRSPGLAQPGLKVPDSWVYEKTRGRCRSLSGSSALAALCVASALRATGAQPGRFHACVSGATRAPIGCPSSSPWQHGRPPP